MDDVVTQILVAFRDGFTTLEDELEMVCLLQEDICEDHKVFCCDVCFDMREIEEVE